MVLSYQYIHRLFQALNFNFFTLSQQGIKYSDFLDLCQKQEAVKEVLGSLAKVRVFCSLSASVFFTVLDHHTFIPDFRSKESNTADLLEVDLYERKGFSIH